MHKRILSKLILFTLILLGIGCAKDEGLKHRTLTGIYKLTSAITSYTYTDATGVYSKSDDLITGACDLQTTIEIRSDGTFQQLDYSGNNCTDPAIRKGTWKVTSTFYGSFNGEVRFADASQPYDLFEAKHVDDVITEFRIEYNDPNPPEHVTNLRYHYTYFRIN
ncbi:MAG: hypothetical protein JXR71_09795 [Bacteroidales bacterium]|nr:hypothetical protein [Bacteroidales bacterium]